MPTVDVQDPVKLEMHSHLDRLMGQPLPTFQSALQGIKDWSPAHEWNQNVQNALFGLGDTIRNVGHAVMHPIDTAKNLPTPSAQDIAMAFNPAHMPTATVAGSLKNFLDPSKEKGVWYHGTAADIKQFKPELGLEKADVSGTPYQAGATFVTQNPEFAHVFAKDSPSYMIQNPERHLTPEQMKSAAEDAKKYFKETYEDMPEHRDAMIKSIEEGKPIGEAQDALTEAYKPYLPSGPNIMPVHVRVTNPFDAAVPEHIDALKKVNPELPFKDMHRTSVLEIPEVQQAIKDAGFDSFYTNEAGNRNLGLFKPEQIKSAIGNEGTYDPTNPVITKKDGGSVTVEDPIKLERFSKFEQEFVKRFDEGGLVTADKTQAPVEESAAFGIYPKSGVPSATPEAQAKALEFSKNLADLVVPQTTADVAMMAMPYGKVGKMIGAGLIAANPNEAGAAMFPRLAVGTLGFMAEHYPESFKAVKEALEKTLKTGNEYAVVHNPYETILHTSNKPDKVMMTPQMMSNMNENVYKPTDTFMMHTHPYGGVGPSKADIKMTAQNPARQIISSPQGDSIIAIDPGKRFSGNSYDSYIDDAQKHIQSEKVQNFLQSKGYLGYGQYNDIEGLASKMAPHEYLRNLATQNRLDYRYNDLGMHTPENSDLDAVPFADILESYWREFYPGSVVEKQPVKKAEGGQVKKKSTIDDLEEDPVLIEHKLKLMGLI